MISFYDEPRRFLRKYCRSSGSAIYSRRRAGSSIFVENHLSTHPQDIDAWRALAEIRLSINDFPLAEEACRKALAIHPDDLTATVSLARILVAQGDKEGAEEASAKARILGWKDELAQDT